MTSQPDLVTARSLLGKALEDQAVVRLALDTGSISDAIAGFHAQQAVEKSIKAVMAARGVQFKFTHDLTYLVGQLEGAGLEVPPPVTAAERLSPFAVEFRYGEFALEAEAELDRAALLELVDTVVGWAEAAIVPPADQ